MTNDFTPTEAASFDSYVANFTQPAPRITLHQALKSVSQHCDHARTHDTVGFSGLDANFANKMAECNRLSAKQEWYVARFVRKYRRQVVANYERSGIQITQGLKGKKREEAVNTFLAGLVWESQSAEEVAKACKPKNVISAAQGANSGDLKHFVVRFPYNARLVEAIKVLDYRDRRFDKSDPKDPKWIVLPTTQAVEGLRRFARENGFVVTDGALAAFEKLVPSQVAA